eukprot:12899923-Prorocentrum_lima.AAC.1
MSDPAATARLGARSKRKVARATCLCECACEGAPLLTMEELMACNIHCDCWLKAPGKHTGQGSCGQVSLEARARMKTPNQ